MGQKYRFRVGDYVIVITRSTRWYAEVFKVEDSAEVEVWGASADPGEPEELVWKAELSLWLEIGRRDAPMVVEALRKALVSIGATTDERIDRSLETHRRIMEEILRGTRDVRGEPVRG